MTPKQKITTVICVLALWLWTWGTLMADLQGDDASPRYQCWHYREHLAFTAGFALFPPMWFMSPFVTGFYQHGWRLSRPQGCEAER